MRKEYPRIKKRLQDGIHPLDISKKSTGTGKNYFLIKAGNGRYVVEYLETDNSRIVNILGIGDRSNSANMKALKKAMKTYYDIDLQYTNFNY